MPMDRIETKKQETARLYEIYKKDPALFVQSSSLEDAKFLRDFGIVIPGKESLPLGYLKLYASDFIVEEIKADGTVCTIDRPLESPAPAAQNGANAKAGALFATLVKCNISTHEAVADMAKTLGCPIQDIRYAGLKDKNAITAQNISFHNIQPEKVYALSSTHYFLKDFRMAKGSMEKGSLKGNRFTLFIRTPQPADQKTFSERADKLGDEGFHNFYYLQRFGAPRFMNYQWGFDIIRGRYKECILSFLSSGSIRENPYFRNMREQIGVLAPDWAKVHELIEPYPMIMFNEHRVVAYLKEHPEDYMGALQAIPEQTMLWVYGFASLLYNEALSMFIQAGERIPPELPLLMSNQKADIDFYAPLLKPLGCYPPPFAYLKPFTNIYLQHRTVKTSEKIKVEKSAFSPEGVVLRFSLDKGEYATTFLSHLFNLVSGKPPEDISPDRADLPQMLEQETIAATLDHFKNIDVSRNVSGFEELENG